MRTRIVLCAHGTTSHRGRSALSSLVNAVRREAVGCDVADAFVDVQQPLLADVLTETSGRRVVVPLMLAHDPETFAALRTATEADELVRVAPAIGPDWVLAEIGVRRLIEAGARTGDTIVMVVPRVDGPRALADVGKAARLLSAVWGGRVHVGVLSGDGTPVEEALDVARAYKRRVVVSMYELVSGEGTAAIGRLGADVVTAPLLDAGAADPQLAALVMNRATTRGSWVEVDAAAR